MRFSTGLHANSHGGQRRPAGSLPEPYGPWRVLAAWWRTSSVRRPRCRGPAWSAARTPDTGPHRVARRSPSLRLPAPATCPWTRSGRTGRDRRTGRRHAATTCRRPSAAPPRRGTGPPGGRLVKRLGRGYACGTTANSERACMAALRAASHKHAGEPMRQTRTVCPGPVTGTRSSAIQAMAKAGRNHHVHGCPRKSGSAVLRSRESP